MKDLSPDPWRYLYAFASLAIDRKPIGTSELSICNVFVALMYGRPLKDGESIVDHRGAAVKTATEVAEAMRAAGMSNAAGGIVASRLLCSQAMPYEHEVTDLLASSPA